MNDFRFALRQLLKAPGLSLVILLSLAVGIGANTVVFTWIHSTLLNAIPAVTAPDRLVVIVPEHRTAGVSDTMSLADIESLAAEQGVFSGITASQFGAVQLRLGEASEWCWGQSTLANFFEVLGARPVLGRGFLPGEDQPGAAERVAVISHEFWQRHFQSSPEVLGRVIEINQRPATIVGVAPPGFVGTMGGLRLDLWVPLATQFTEAEMQPRLHQHGWRWLHTVGRLAPGVPRHQANAAAAVVSQSLARQFPESSRDTVLRVIPVWASQWGGQALFLPLLRVLAMVAALLLLLVIVNVANLLLARAQARQNEFGIRLALGASAARLVRQLLTESVLLALLGGTLGVALAVRGTQALFSLMPPTYLPIGYDLHVNWNVLGIVSALTVLTGLLFGLAPAFQAARLNVNETLKTGARTSSGFGPRHAWRRAFVVGQVGLAFVLLLGMGLCVRSLGQARTVDLGLDPRGIWLAGFRLSSHVGDNNAVHGFYQRLQAEAARLPGVQSAALADWLPLGFEGGSGSNVKIPGYVPRPGEDMSTSLAVVTPDYFPTFRIPILDGREFASSDNSNSPPVCVINQAFAQRFFPGRNPLGLTIWIWGRDTRIVGVVPTGKYRSLNEAAHPFTYLPVAQANVRTLTLAVRTQGDPRQLAGAVSKLALALDPAAAPVAALPYEDFVAAAFTTPRLAATLLSILGVLGLALAILGIYAVMSQSVGQRVRELGIRLALGARPGDVQRLILGQGLALAGVGLGAGAVAGIAVCHLLSSLLIGVSPADLTTWLLVPFLLFVAAFATCWLPARRASRVDPIVALRTE